MTKGFLVAFIFVYIPVALLFLFIKPLGELGWLDLCISLPTLIITIALGKILQGEL